MGQCHWNEPKPAKPKNIYRSVLAVRSNTKSRSRRSSRTPPFGSTRLNAVPAAAVNGGTVTPWPGPVADHQS
jgi:hypothetical protein